MLLDSDVLIDYLRGREPARTVLRNLFATGRLQTSVVNQFELLAASRQTTAQLEAVTNLLGTLKIIGLDSESAFAAGAIRRDLSAGGVDIGMADCLIAGIALTHSLPLVSRNRRHFARVPQLHLVELSSLEPRTKA